MASNVLEPNERNGETIMSELTEGVSWAAVFSGAVLSFILGWLWYSPKAFGPKWAKGHNIEMGTANDMPMVAMATQITGLFLMSWFVAVTAVSEALFTVILATVAFTVLAYSAGAFAKKPAAVRNIDAGYWLVSLIIMIISNGVFRNLAA